MRANTNIKAQYWWWSYIGQLYSSFYNVRNWLLPVDLSQKFQS